MDAIELLKRCQGQMSQAEFAELIGISQSHLSMIYSGQRSASEPVMLKLAKAFPEIRDEVLCLFFPREYHNRNDSITENVNAA